MRDAAKAAALAAAFALAPGCSPASGPAPEPVPGAPSIRLTASPSGQRTIDVAGLAAADLAHLERAALSRDGWQAILRVHVAQVDPASVELPAGARRLRRARRRAALHPAVSVRCGSTLRGGVRSGVPSVRARPFRFHPVARPPHDGRGAGSRPRAVDPHRRRLSDRSGGAREPPPPVHRLLRTDGPGRRWCALPAARRARPPGCRPVSAAGRRPVERGSHALHGSLRPGGASSAASGRTPSWAARCRRTEGTRW